MKNSCKKMLAFLLAGVMILGVWIPAVTMVEEAQAATPKQDWNVYNFLLVGTDFGGRGDAVMIISANTAKETVYTTSIMRDTIVKYNGKEQKIKFVIQQGGIKDMVACVEENFGIKIDNYAYTDFQNCAKIFDILGGMNITLNKEEVEALNTRTPGMAAHYGVKYTKTIAGPGEVHLDGWQSVMYCRDRYTGYHDFNRTQHHRYAITKARDVLKYGSVAKRAQLVKAITACMKTNMNAERLDRMITKLNTFLTYEISNGIRFPQDNKFTTDKDAGLHYNFAEASKTLIQLLYSKPNFTFKDVKANDYFRSSIIYLNERDLVHGTSAITFSPWGKLTRADAIVLLWNLSGFPNASLKEKAYPDVELNKYYAKAISWGKKVGIVHGYENGKFGPSDPISRQDFIIMLRNYAMSKELNTNILKNNIYKKCKDAALVSGYAAGAIEWAYERGFIGANGTLNPKSNINRADTVTMLKRYLQYFTM